MPDTALALDGQSHGWSRMELHYSVGSLEWAAGKADPACAGKAHYWCLGASCATRSHAWASTHLNPKAEPWYGAARVKGSVLAAGRKAAVKAPEPPYALGLSVHIRTSSSTKASWIDLISV